MRLKTAGEETEFHDVDFGLQQMLLFMDAYSQHFFQVELVVTELIRTDAEQDSIYGDDPEYQADPWKSYHQFKRAADLRYNLTFEQWTELLTMAERLFEVPYDVFYVVHVPNNPDGWTPHVHIEIRVPYSEEMFA